MLYGQRASGPSGREGRERTSTPDETGTRPRLPLRGRLAAGPALLLAAALGLLLPAAPALADYRLPSRFGGTSDDTVSGTALDASGNLYMTGFFSGTVTFGTAAPLTSNGSRDVFVLKMDVQGNVLWAVKGGSSREDYPSAGIALDSNGDAYIGGWTDGNDTQFGTTTPLTLPGAFVAKIDKTGAWQWSRGLSSQPFTNNFLPAVGLSIAVAPQSDNVYLGGICSAEARDAQTNQLIGHCSDYFLSGGNIFSDPAGFVASYRASNGARRWFAPLRAVRDTGGGTQVIEALQLAVGSEDNGNGPEDTIHIATVCQDTDTSCFLADPNDVDDTVAGHLAIAGDPKGRLGILRVRDTGGVPAEDWVASASGLSTADDGFPTQHPAEQSREGTNLAMAVDADGNLYLTGAYSGSPDLGGTSLSLPNVSNTGVDRKVTMPFVAKLNSSGNWLWASVLSDDPNDTLAIESRSPYTTGRAISLDAQGHVYVGGSYRAAVRFQHRPGMTGSFTDAGLRLGNPDLAGSPTNEELHDAFVAQLSAQDGSWQWARHAGSTGEAWTQALSADPGGTVFAAGSFAQTLGFYDPNDSTAGSPTLTTAGTNLGRLDVWIHSLSPSGNWREAQSWTIGQALAPPSPNLPLLQPDIVITGGGNATDYFFWSELEKKLYPLRTGSADVKWKVSMDPLNTARESLFGQSIWPLAVQSHISGAPASLQRASSSGATFYQIPYSESGAAADTATKVFTAPGTGYSTLMYTLGTLGDPAQEPVSFDVVKTESWKLAPAFVSGAACVIGTPLSDASHDDPENKNGYVLFANARYDGSGTDRAHDRASRTGPILPVNTDVADDVDDMVVVWYQTSARGIGWPVKPVRYDCQWPGAPQQIVIASLLGNEIDGQLALDTTATPSPRVYFQNDRSLPGYNPNEEHALLVSSKLYALASGLDGASLGHLPTSEPYVLLKHWDDKGDTDPQNDAWAMDVYQVSAERNPDYLFSSFTGQAGELLRPPTPLDQLPACQQSVGTGVPFFRDRTGAVWARSDGTVDVRYFYPLTTGFYYDLTGDGFADKQPGECVPWLDRYAQTPGNPINVRYNITWPSGVPVLAVGETLLTQKNFLPNIKNAASVQIIYDQQDPDGVDPLNRRLATLYAPMVERRVPLDPFPDDAIATAPDGPNLSILSNATGTVKVPFHLRKRLFYDPLEHELVFRGFLDESGTGDPLLLPNVMTGAELNFLFDLDGTLGNTGTGWDAAVRDLYHLSRNPSQVDATAPAGPDQEYRVGIVDNGGTLERQGFVGAAEVKALSAGTTTGTGFLTLVFNNDPTLTEAVDVKVIRVDCPVYRGEIEVIPSDNVFDEQLTLRHSGDFAGKTDELTFDWYLKYDTDPDVVPPDGATPTGNWLQWSVVNPGAVDITISGPGPRTLSDNHVILRYTGFEACGNDSGTPSPWAGAPGNIPSALFAQLAEGWVKRVTAAINPFEQKVTNFHASAVDTFISMIRQAGQRYEGDIALNSDAGNLNSIGLIETYQTVLNRARKLSIDASGSGRVTDHAAVNNALLNAASRISALYMLLGNESYSDALDPTIGFSTSSTQYGNLAPSIFSFQNQLASLLEEELVLLRGRDDSSGSTSARPVYNHLLWNFTTGEGEVAYQQTYNISDQDIDGFINETDARILYPQGHGDAWGHFLTAVTTYYGLLRHPAFQWTPRTEQVLVAGSPVNVDFLDERKFASAAAAKARVGAELVNLTYRQSYVEDPAGQWQGYKDTDPERAWGLAEWGQRAGEGAYLDWLAANAILPATDTQHTGIQKIDRSTVVELDEILSHYQSIQSQMDLADRGLNPLGLAKGVVPFDIDPSLIDGGETHFEQIYNRALAALTNTVTVFDHANKLTERLRNNQDSIDGFKNNVVDREADFKNRLIEIFGYPYSDDIGPGGTYPSAYDGPDLYHHMIVEPGDLTGVAAAPEARTFFTGYFSQLKDGSFFTGGVSDALQGPLDTVFMEVGFYEDHSGYGIVKPVEWTGVRRAPGDLQLALSDVYQARGRLERAIQDHQGLLYNISVMLDTLSAQKNLHSNEITVKAGQISAEITLNTLIAYMESAKDAAEAGSEAAKRSAEQTAECQPKVVGIANDATSVTRCTTLLFGTMASFSFDRASAKFDLGVQVANFAKDLLEKSTELELESERNEFEITQALGEIKMQIGNEAPLRITMITEREALQKAMGSYYQKLAEGQRLLDDLIRFRKQTAATVQDYRYQDMAFRVMRNDSLQKYRAQFDLAARYAFLAATAYDFETNLLGTAGAAGQKFLTDIVRFRSLGQVLVSPDFTGIPIAGSNGLADPLARMKQNFDVLKGQLGFNNPQTESNRFSLRHELFRMRDSSNEEWREKLEELRVADLWALPEFRRHCRPFTPESTGPQPGIVIPFSTTVTSGLNYFGWPLGGEDNAYDSSHFATKVRSVGVWFTSYDGAGLSNTPRVYLVPAGSDVLRSPTGDGGSTREWSVLDQLLPVPFPIGSTSLSDPDWIPMADSLSGPMAEIRRLSAFRAYHDGGEFVEGETVTESRLIGRSVWNSRWLLVIPGATLLNDPDAGIDKFIGEPDGASGVTDVKIFFQTYAYSGI